MVDLYVIYVFLNSFVNKVILWCFFCVFFDNLIILNDYNMDVVILFFVCSMWYK